MNSEKYNEGDLVTIHSLGPLYEGKEFRGYIRGLACEIATLKIYIIELYDQIDENYPYSCVTMPESCIKSGWF